MSQGKARTHSEYEQELFDKEIDFVPLEKYRNKDTAILHECIEGHQWKITPGHILRGIGCPQCHSKRMTKTNEQYVSEIWIDAKPLELYIRSTTPILHQCSRGHTWKSTPQNILKGHGCSKCNSVGGYNKTRFARDRELASSPGILYCIVLVHRKTFDRTCVKLGITKGTSNKDVLKRAAGFSGYEPRIQKLVYGTLEEVFNLEQDLHHLWSNYQYTDSHRFPGHTELFKIDMLKDILKSIPDEIGPPKI